MLNGFKTAKKALCALCALVAVIPSALAASFSVSSSGKAAVSRTARRKNSAEVKKADFLICKQGQEDRRLRICKKRLIRVRTHDAGYDRHDRHASRDSSRIRGHSRWDSHNRPRSDAQRRRYFYNPYAGKSHLRLRSHAEKRSRFRNDWYPPAPPRRGIRGEDPRVKPPSAMIH